MAEDGSSTEAWRTITQYLPPRNPDYDYWWQVTGRHLAILVDAAEYSVGAQYEALMFHYHWTVSKKPFSIVIC